MPGFVKIAETLIRCLKKCQPNEFNFEKREGATMYSLKARLTSPPLLALPKSTIEYTVDPNSSDGQLGRVQLQEQDDKQ